MKLLVTISSYGIGNDPYLERVIEEYRAMPYKVEIVILSNVARKAPPGVEIVVGIPTRDPWSLPFAHKRILSERVGDYDLFMYSENDVLITRANIEAFLWATNCLAEDEVAGFLRTELGGDGQTYFPEVNKMYHWDPQSIGKRGDHVFACFTCEHAGCYLLNRRQLSKAIDSGGFLVEPHSGHYDLACSAATDPYTQCGLKKMICVSDLDKFLVSHLSNKYVGTEYDLPESDFRLQLQALLEISEGARPASKLLRPNPLLTTSRWSKHYYEPPRPDVIELIPAEAKTVLSVGCGWGAIEECVTQQGRRVVGVPLDSVISACAAARGVETVASDFETAWADLEGMSFDCVLISNVLHLVPNPLEILRKCVKLLSNGGCIILAVPNFSYLKTRWRRLRRWPEYRDLGDYDKAGVNLTTHRLIQKWLTHSGLDMDRIVELIPGRVQRLPKIGARYLAYELIVRCRKNSAMHPKPASEIATRDRHYDPHMSQPQPITTD